MKTVTFYSYKGGVGRTLALTNVVEYLSLFQKKVCIIDFDLEAPGINYKLEEKTKSSITLQEGIVDYMHHFFIKSKETAFPETIKDYVIDVSFPNREKYKDVMYIPAGDPQKSSYWDQLSELNWQDFFYKGNRYGVPFFIELKERIQQELQPDFLLIDSRTGISQILGITASILSDQVIVLGANNKENLDGAALVLESISKKENHVLDKQLQINFVLTRIPYPETEAEELREKKRIQEVQDTLNEKLGEGIIKEILVIHSDRELEWKEETRITGDRTQPITQDYLRLFHALTEGSLLKDEKEWLERIAKSKELYDQSFKEEDIAKKINILTEAIDLDADNEQAYFERGHFYCELEKYSLAIKDNTKGINLNPEYALAYNNRGYAFYAQEKYDKAIDDYNKAIELNPEILITYNNRGLVFTEQKRYDKAIGDFTKSLDLNPEDSDIYNIRGYIFYTQKKYDLAILDYTRAIELRPNEALFYHNRGYIFYTQKKYDLAILDYTKTIELSSELTLSYNNRAVSYRGLKKYELALKDINKALELDPKHGYLYGTLAEIHADQNNQKEFYKNIELALKYDCPVQEELDEEIYNQYKDKKRFQDLLKKYAKNKK